MEEIISKVKEVIAEALGVDVNDIHEKLEFNGIPEWDSLGHISIVTGLATHFNIPLNEEVIKGSRSFEGIVNIINKAEQ